MRNKEEIPTKKMQSRRQSIFFLSLIIIKLNNIITNNGTNAIMALWWNKNKKPAIIEEYQKYLLLWTETRCSWMKKNKMQNNNVVSAWGFPVREYIMFWDETEIIAAPIKPTDLLNNFWPIK